MRTWGSSGAGAVLRRAQAVSRLARAEGCGVDEAAEMLARPVSRRAVLGVGAAAGLGVLPAALPWRREVAGSAARHAPRVVIAGSGIAGLGCALRLWHRYGIRAQLCEWNTVPGGRIRTLRGYFGDGQLV